MSELTSIQCHYQLARPAGFVLDVALDIPMRGVVGITGESGSGKSTLLRCLAGLERPDHGKLAVAGEVWQDAQTFRPVQQRDIAYVFQEPRLFDHLSVADNIQFAARYRSAGQTVACEAIAAKLGLSALLERRPKELSGGEAQRVAIARALASSPRFMLMDEPLASLDLARRQEILPYLEALHRDRQVPILYVSHSMDELTQLCDYLICLQEGEVIANGSLQSVLVDLQQAAAAGAHAGTVIEAVAVEHDTADQLTRMHFSGGDLWVPGQHSGKNRLRIRASDVSLCRQAPSASSILNVLPVTVDSVLESDDAWALIRLCAGNDVLLASITRRSLRSLNLAKDEVVFAQIKTVAVRRSGV